MGSWSDSGACPEQSSEGAARPRGSADVGGVVEIRETPVAGNIPRFQIPHWQERYGVIAGITGRGIDPGRGFDLGLWSREPVGDVMSRWLTFRRALSEFQAVALGNQAHGVEILSLNAAAGWVQ
ncbi:MAG TPA: hypothetical protein VFS51_09545, partial [Gemmatimonadales bacterium]|nr:hypothetical protein [Gemmatimonadales bacterium]